MLETRGAPSPAPSPSASTPPTPVATHVVASTAQDEDPIKSNPTFSDAGGGLINVLVALLLSGYGVGRWKAGKRLVGAVSFLAGAFLVLPLLLFTFGYGRWRAWLLGPMLVWQVVSLPAPFWFPFLLGLVLGAVVSMLFLRRRLPTALPAEEQPAAALSPPIPAPIQAPAREEQALWSSPANDDKPWTPDGCSQAWSCLIEAEQTALWGMWESQETFIGPEVIKAVSKEIGHGEWNAIQQRLKVARLIKREGSGWELTEHGREVMTWATRTQKRPEHLR